VTAPTSPPPADEPPLANEPSSANEPPQANERPPLDERPPANEGESRSSRPHSQKGQSTAGLWTVALIIAAMVAFLGVSAAMDSIQRKQYAEVRVAAVYLVRNGNAIGASMRRLEEVNARNLSLVKDTRDAREAGNTSLFDRLVAQAEINNVEQLRLQQEVRKYQAAFDQVFTP
jgi:hypothetical protein